MKLSDDIQVIKGIGPKKCQLFNKLGIFNVEDMLRYYPRKYQDRRTTYSIFEAPFNEEVLLEVMVRSKVNVGRFRAKNKMLKVFTEDSSGTLDLLFFNAGFLDRYIKVGDELTVYGKISLNNNRRVMTHPEFFHKGDKDDIRGLLPIYPLTEGLSQKTFREIHRIIKPVIEEIREWLPDEIIKENNLCSPSYAVRNIHFPKEERSFLESKYRLCFEELLTLETGLEFIKNGNKTSIKGVKIGKNISIDKFIDGLTFQLTEGQSRVIREIETDLESDKPMNRLVQGDVGSGKTIVSETAIYKTVLDGYQAVMMAPTEILAKQHYENLKKDFSRYGIDVEMLSSSIKKSKRDEILFRLKTGEINVLVGTHALIQPDVEFNNLGLVITDEQHRFGVNQRGKLQEKGTNPNVLVMTATPIPRTLAVILYGDLDISVIDTMPKGRKPIRTFLRTSASRKKIYDFVEAQVKEGRQAYVVAPLIDESDKMDLNSATVIFQELSKKYKNVRFSLIHGEMKQDEKDKIMESFLNKEIDVLVSTVVIEVGIDVPNSTVMVIENSERFGLAQLHQLRGRVGRSEYQSYCILISDSKSKISQERNKIMCETGDGFIIAEEDLRLRGPGEIFGTKQHGLPELSIADLIKNVDILDKTKLWAERIIEDDNSLIKIENRPLRERVIKMFGENIDLKL